MRKIDYKEGRAMEQTHVCKECGGGLVTAWYRGDSPGWGYHVLKCSEHNNHFGEVKKRWAPMEAQPIEVQNGLKRKERNAGNRRVCGSNYE